MKRACLLGVAVALLAGCAVAGAPEPPLPAPTTRAEAQAAVQRGEGRGTLDALEREAADLDRAERRLDAAKAWGKVTHLGFRLGELQKAIRAGLRALELLKPEPPTDETRFVEVVVHNNLGHTYLLAGDPGEARRHFQAGLELAGAIPERRRRLIWSATLSRGLANVEEGQGEHAKALQHAGETVRALEDVLAHLPPRRADRARRNASQQLARALLIVGSAQRRLDRLDEAEAALGRALDLAKEGRVLEVEASAIFSLGYVSLSRKDYARAAARFQEAEAIATRIGRVSLIIATRAGTGWSALDQGKPADALAAFVASLALVEDVRGQFEDTGLRSGFLEDKQRIYHGAVQSALAAGRPDEAFGFSERARARAFLDLLGTRTTLSKGRTLALAEEEQRLRARLREARAQGEEPPDEGEGEATPPRAEAEAAEQAYRAFLDRVRKESGEQASLMTVEPVTLQDVQAALPEGTTLLEYLVSANEVLLWVVDRSRVEVVRVPVPRRALLAQVRELRQAIARQAPVEEVQQQAGALYASLLAPARPLIHGDRLLIVPHDVLHYLPWGALRSPEGKWLVEDFTLATLPSASVLKFLQAKGADASDRVLALGNPDLGPALALRWAEREARAVGERFPQATVLVRAQATETRVKTLGPQAGLLHFATHGELNEQDPLASALLLVPEGAEDGRLEVRELFALDLHARLVVLSACQTGLGKLSKGDELVGLQRAFLYAGTPAVVTTLWKVDDRASFLLMRQFYDQLAKGQGPAEALRQAQRAAMREFPHPFAWAAFGLTGAPR